MNMNKSLTIIAALAVAMATGVSAQDSCPPVDLCSDSSENLIRDSSGYYLRACLFSRGDDVLVCPRIPLGQEVLDTVEDMFDTKWGYGGTSPDGGTTQGVDYLSRSGCADGWEYYPSTGGCWHACEAEMLTPVRGCPGDDDAVTETVTVTPPAAPPVIPPSGDGYRDIERCGVFTGFRTVNYFWNSTDPDYHGQHGNIRLPEGKDPQPAGSVMTTIRFYDRGSTPRVTDYAGACDT